MTSDFNSPYNITITNHSPVVNYFPYRDGTLDAGWNLTCADSLESAWSPTSFCFGESSHRSSFVGATLTILFEGTAIYLYGNATLSSYAIFVDGQDSTSFSSALSSGLLGESIGMTFAKHTLTLTIIQPGLVSFSYAILTVGVGRGDSKNNIQNRTLSAFVMDSNVNLSVNPMFSYVGATWESSLPGVINDSNVAYPRRDTYTVGDYMTFTISQASAIFVYSDVSDAKGQFNVTFTPPPEVGQPVTTTYNAYAHWLSLDRVLFWAAGMDRDKNYTVKITNIANTGSLPPTPWIDFHHLDVLDATSVGPAISSSTSTATDASNLNVTPIGAIVGGTIGGFIILVVLIIGFFVYRRRKRNETVTGYTMRTTQPGI